MRINLNKNKILFPLAFVIAWQLLSISGILPANRIPSPFEIILALKELFIMGLPQGKVLIYHCLFSLIRVLGGFMSASVVAIPMGILLGRSKRLHDMFIPIIEIIRPVPPLAWIPLAILWFGIGLKSAVFIIFLGCFFPILLSTISGVLSVDKVLIDAAKILGAQERDIFYKVLLPGSFPSIYTGLRIGMGIGWMTLVAAEFTGVKSGYGVGYMIMTARDIQRPDFILAGMVTIGVIGFMLDLLLRLCEKRALRWRE
jgi:ABC-type nitrate/sulfonate/bicarbonate transport system permease component